MPVELIRGAAGATGVVPQLGAGLNAPVAAGAAKELAAGLAGLTGLAPGTVGAKAPGAEGLLDGMLTPKLDPPIDALAENPPDEGLGVDGLGEPPLLAASNAFILASLSPPANIMPLNVPVKNVAIGIINSKNF